MVQYKHKLIAKLPSMLDALKKEPEITHWLIIFEHENKSPIIIASVVL